jgi:Fe-S-cluster containining protein
MKPQVPWLIHALTSSPSLESTDSSQILANHGGPLRTALFKFDRPSLNTDNAAVQIHFACTRCGNCCRNLKLPLTVAEAIGWIGDGNSVQVICEAVPWPTEPPASDQMAAHRRRRSFAAMSGAMPTRVIVILAAHFTGACPNLGADMQCGIYERRPLVCRIYPAEINPFIRLEPANKACPPEAWAADGPVLQRNGCVEDDVVRANIERSRLNDALDARIKARLCAALHLNAAALAEEGFVVYSPDRAILLDELKRAAEDQGMGVPETSWEFASNQSSTVASIASIGAIGSLVGNEDDRPYEYLGFKAASDRRQAP